MFISVFYLLDTASA